MTPSSFDRMRAGLMQLALFVVPLMALFPSAGAVAGEREVGTLDYLLAQPVTRAEVFTGKWLGVAAAVLISLATWTVGAFAAGRRAFRSPERRSAGADPSGTRTARGGLHRRSATGRSHPVL